MDAIIVVTFPPLKWMEMGKKATGLLRADVFLPEIWTTELTSIPVIVSAVIQDSRFFIFRFTHSIHLHFNFLSNNFRLELGKNLTPTQRLVKL